MLDALGSPGEGRHIDPISGDHFEIAVGGVVAGGLDVVRMTLDALVLKIDHDPLERVGSYLLVQRRNRNIVHHDVAVWRVVLAPIEKLQAGRQILAIQADGRSGQRRQGHLFVGFHVREKTRIARAPPRTE